LRGQIAAKHAGVVGDDDVELVIVIVVVVVVRSSQAKSGQIHKYIGRQMRTLECGPCSDPGCALLARSEPE